MLTARQINDLPLGFTPIPKTNFKSGKSTKHRTGIQGVKIHQKLPSGKIILRTQPSADLKLLIKNNAGSFTHCKRPNIKVD